jgi:hypothetical protein
MASTTPSSAPRFNTGGKLRDGAHSFISAPTLAEVLAEVASDGFAVAMVKLTSGEERRLVVQPSRWGEPLASDKEWLFPCLMWNGRPKPIAAKCRFSTSGRGQLEIDSW